MKFPPWLRQKLPAEPKSYFETKDLLNNFCLSTVCEEAKCPNRFCCFEKKTATFLALGKWCTRKCRFCDIGFSSNPKQADPNEPKKIAAIAQKMGLKHVVVTMVARDDLPDGGASHMANIILEIKKVNPSRTVEVLTSDFSGKTELVDIIIQAKPDIFNHNIETTLSLSAKIRNKASYHTSLNLIKYVKKKNSSILVKSGLMVGLGEKPEEVKRTISDLKDSLCNIITIGQYLQPSSKCIAVKEFVSLETFKEYENFGLNLGIKHMLCGPFVRSSFHAENILNAVTK